ncbi:hypothetical protein DSO57_1004415 [Entomophthora muscae]|uniref:Uncharacterized protein n=1 Tax=Entomophthora muscae TaxID=34485 RepID=A0ACC2TJ94_9FUNG|nr:hypothetical protein DSO57_1004415 [Entomophthora muscae]
MKASSIVKEGQEISPSTSLYISAELVSRLISASALPSGLKPHSCAISLKLDVTPAAYWTLAVVLLLLGGHQGVSWVKARDQLGWDDILQV